MPAIGYVGVDTLNNATICNEAAGLLEAGVSIEPVSAYRYETPTYNRGPMVEQLAARLTHLYPLSPAQVAQDLTAGPLVFGRRFFTAQAAALRCPAEGLRQRGRVLGHFLPGLRLALAWKDKDVRHIHAHWAHTATTIAMHAAALLGVGFSFTGHANDIFVYTVALREKLRRARFVVCIAEYHRRFYLAQGADPERLKVVYCGIDTARFRVEGPAETPARPRIVAVGRLVEKKGLYHLIAACQRLKRRGLEFECHIHGSGPQEQQLRDLAARLDVDDRVTVTGKVVLQQDLPGILRAARVVALPCVEARDGDKDGLPQVLIEAMCCGVPVVSTALVGIPDLVRDGTHGFLVPSGEINQLSDRLAVLLEDADCARRMGARSAAWAREHFGRDSTVERLSRLFRWCQEQPGNAAPPLAMPAAPGSEELYDRHGEPRTDYLRGLATAQGARG